MLRTVLLLGIALAFVGCAFGRKQDYLQAQPALGSTGQGSLSLGVQDLRPYVVNHEKDETFVGLQRGGYGNPFDVSTQSKQPLADDMAKVLAKALSRSAGTVQTVRLPPALDKPAVIRALQSSHPDRSLLLSLHEWKSDTYMGTKLVYDAEMEVIDPHGRSVARRRIQGEDDLGGAFWDPQGHAQEAAPLAFKRKMEELFSGEIAEALGKAAR